MTVGQEYPSDLRDLLLSVAKATAELCAEEYEGGADIWAERQQIADQIVRLTVEEAAGDADAPFNHVLCHIGIDPEVWRRETA